MKTLLRTLNHDIFTNAGQLAMCDGKLAYAQILEAAILTVKGELQLDEERGIPYFSTIFRSQRRANQWKNLVIRRVMEFDFVKSVLNFSYSVDNRNHVINYSMSVSTDIGTATLKSLAYDFSTTPSTPSGGEPMETLVQNGIFYLPVYKENGIQVYRQLKQYVDPGMGGVTTELSEKTYVKNSDGVFVENL